MKGTCKGESETMKNGKSNGKRGRARKGIANVVSSVIMILAVTMMGVVTLGWANTSFSAQQKQMTESFQETSNTIKEMYVIEDIWLSKVPVNYVNITIRNVGTIGLEIDSIKIQGDSSSYTWTPPADTVLRPKEAYHAGIPFVWNTETILDIYVSTERGSMERSMWKVQ